MEAAEPTIHVLPESVASQIAAGEIVERPASVVKELIDNSLDAGGAVISVEIVDGGKTLIRVIDDGAGMSRADAVLACRRFATSKLRHQHDLSAIDTYGFRGEALPSIAAVSRLWMLTARHRSSAGTSVSIEGGNPSSVDERGAAPGTRVEVAELFFNTPGRRKFLKTTATECSHIAHVVQQAALANVHAQFRLTHNDHLMFDYPGVAALDDRLLQIYGTHMMKTMLSIHGEASGVRVRGMTVDPCHTRTSRTPQEIFVNRRAVKNTTIAHAVYASYGSFLPKGRHPTFAIMVDVEADAVDVNVHPSKREVKFRSPDQIYHAIYDAVRRPLHSGAAASTTSPPVAPAFDDADAAVAGRAAHRHEEAGPSGATSRDRSAWPAPAPDAVTLTGRDDALRVEEALPLYTRDLDVRIFGQIHATYILAQIGDALHVLDQHTIHERVLFERLWRDWEGQRTRTQPLLIPEPVDLPIAVMTRLEEHLPALATLGLELERLGPSSFVIRSAPALVGPMDYGALLEDILDDVSTWKSSDALDKRVRPILASIACQGAVRAGRRMEEPEMRQVVRDWLQEGVPMTCPHGRRISMRFGSDELHRMFRRL